MKFDGHVHIMSQDVQAVTSFATELAAANLTGALVMSLPPPGYNDISVSFEKRLDMLVKIVEGQANLFPFMWIDPLDSDAENQIKLAVETGVDGFKIICDHFYPSNKQAIKVYRNIANVEKPLLFHCGMLGDGKFSSLYNRPAEFECLLDIPDLRFSLAHLGWPWCDEFIAVALKFQNLHRRDSSRYPEMFIDNTPGTPYIYRREVLIKLFTVCEAMNNFYYGSDLLAENYRSKRSAEIIQSDDKIYSELGFSEAEKEKFYSTNLLNFLQKDLPA
jgi:predicted TIM-barrel fold metal-dependent hydrolase